MFCEIDVYWVGIDMHNSNVISYHIINCRAEEVMKSKELQDKEIGKFVAEREQLIQNHKDKQMEMKKRHWEEELELEKEFDAALTKLMAKYAPDGAAIAFANA